MGILMKYTIAAILLVITVSIAVTNETSKTIILGHTEDIISRISDDQLIEGKVTAEGEFDQDAEGRDLAHWANGTVQITEKNGKRYIQLTEDFNSGPLPDGYVYYSHDDDVNTPTILIAHDRSKQASLSKAKAQASTKSRSMLK